MPALTLRWKIAAAVVAVSCLAVVFLGVAIERSSDVQRYDQTRGFALARLDAATQSYGQTGSLSGTGFALDDARLPPALREAASRGRKATMLASDAAGPAAWAAAGVAGHLVSVRLSYQRQQDANNELDRTIVLASGGAVIAAAAAGALLAGGLSRRLRAAAKTAGRIAGGDLDARIGASGRDEIAGLSSAIDSMTEALGSRIEAEQRFTADVAHELRTPLTGLLTAAEILPPSRPAELVLNRVKALRLLVEDLLEVSRLDARAETADLQPAMLGELVRRSVSSTGLPCEVDVVADTEVLTDARHLDRILANLIVNAHRHGVPPVIVTISGPTVSVSDHGPGFPEDLIRSGPRRFKTGSRERGHGSGLGLTIAMGHAAVIGARLSFMNPPGGGARAELTLPTSGPS